MRLSKARKACVTTMMKDTIFEAASSLLEQHGSDAITMNQVATKVGFATASLYNYFQDKDDLLHFCYSRLVEPCLQAIGEVAGTDLPARRKLERILRTALGYAVKHKGLIRLLAGMDYDSKIRKDTRPRLLQILTTIFQRGIEEGSLFRQRQCLAAVVREPHAVALPSHHLLQELGVELIVLSHQDT